MPTSGNLEEIKLERAASHSAVEVPRPGGRPSGMMLRLPAQKRPTMASEEMRTLSTQAARVGRLKKGANNSNRIAKKSQAPKRAARITEMSADVETAVVDSLFETKREFNRKTNRLKQVLTCGLCRMRSERLSNMRDHIRGHLKFKPHVCRHCGKGFSQAFNRQRHEKEGSCLRSKT